ncbi:MAG: sulfurtransferase complex subunit TusB [Nitrospirota bacterium]|uniref:Sulfur relay protein TusB n=1 Tax=Candidatus Magnetominusculus xianensis TaxID=1748249 RepID=A0ABR5SE00_9BACT|nr:sulfurtransferase complex subunit TusB [Candidatus Magnetominusculus xianensis]KWT83681.1 sulfur relay protein TusB [Candidatus Magnetominusculus xianensis]MBF0402621.1 sulfurtransferase complex subunit TusB [Nitrospirota bacterium]
MKVGVFLSEHTKSNDTLDRLSAGSFDLVLVQNAVYSAALKENGQKSPVLGKGAKVYALSEDLVSRGIEPSQVDSGVTVVDYDGLVDIIFNEFGKTIWL